MKIGKMIGAPFALIGKSFAAIGEDFSDTRKIVKKQAEERNAYKKLVLTDPKEIDAFKSKFGLWDEWTGSTFVRRENPKPIRNARNPANNTVMHAICESDPVHGWRAKP